MKWLVVYASRGTEHGEVVEATSSEHAAYIAGHGWVEGSEPEFRRVVRMPDSAECRHYWSDRLPQVPT